VREGHNFRSLSDAASRAVERVLKKQKFFLSFFPFLDDACFALPPLHARPEGLSPPLLLLLLLFAVDDGDRLGSLASALELTPRNRGWVSAEREAAAERCVSIGENDAAPAAD